MMSDREVSDLVAMLQAPNQTLEHSLQAYHKTFVRADHFNTGCALLVLLEERDLLGSQTERIIAFFMLYDFYKQESIVLNPFFPLFVEMLGTTAKESDAGSAARGVAGGAGAAAGWYAVSPVERQWIITLIEAQDGMKDYIKKTPEQIMAEMGERQRTVDINALQQSTRHRLRGGVPARVGHSVRAVLSDPCDSPAANLNSREPAKKALNALSKGSPHVFVTRDVAPARARPPPPLWDRDEGVWLAFRPSFGKVQWDYDMCIESDRGAEIRGLMAKAFQAPLGVAQQNKVYNALMSDPKLVFHIGLTPQKLPQLVENNSNIAIEVLLKLMSSSQIADYFSVLVNMDMSLHSMAVVNKLTSAIELPMEFIHLYISNCISTCRTIDDKYMQNRLVRLVCVFLQSLIRNRIINVQYLFIEVQAFCIEFSRIREAARLFQLLKSLDNNNNSNNSSGGGGGGVRPETVQQ